MTVASGQTASLTMPDCTGGFGIGGIATQPLHGTASSDFTNTLTYTNTQTGFATDSFQYHDDSTGVFTVHVTITGGTPTISPASGALPGGTATVAYTSQTLTASNGAPPYLFTVTGGAPPNGLSLSPSGVISGTPTVAGNASFTVTVTDSASHTGTANYTINIAAAPVPVITPGTGALASATATTFYTQTLTASNGTAPYTFLVTSGAPPAGLTLSSAGVLAGTPTTVGNPSFTVTVTDSASRTGTATYSLAVSAPLISLTPTQLAAMTRHVATNQTIAASGGSGAYTFAVTGGTLPAGLSLSSAGLLTGAPNASGPYNFTVTATDTSLPTGFSGSRLYANVITAPTITLTPSTLSNPVLGTAYTPSLSASGGVAPYTFTVTTGTLPAPLNLSSAGSFSGTPTEVGSHTFTVTATDANGNTGTQSYTLVVATPTLALNPGTLPNGAVGASFTQALTASNGTAPYTYSVVDPQDLPPGITFAGNTLSGTPTGGGTFTFTAQASDSTTGTGAPIIIQKQYTITVTAPTITLTPGAQTFNADYITSFSQTFSATGGIGPYQYVLTGTLPHGLTMNAATGVLSGVATQPGDFPITIHATDSSTGSGPYQSAAISYTIHVGQPSIIVSPATLPTGTSGVPYSAQLSATGGVAPYAYVVDTGTLPTGISLASTGAFSGTPTQVTSAPVTIKVTDANGVTTSLPYSVVVNQATLALNPATVPGATAETLYTQTLTTTGGVAPYHYAVTSGALPNGVTLATNGTLSGTPSVAGTFPFTVTSTDSGTGTSSQVTGNYTLAVAAPGITITPATLPAARRSSSYDQQLTATGGNGVYTFSVTAGAVPAGLALAPNGHITGTPTTAGNPAFTVTVTDSLNFTGTQAYTIAVSEVVPIVVNDTATTKADTAVSIPVTNNDTGPITSIALGAHPTHGSAAINGLNVVYTPAQDFFGTDTLTYTATGPGGTSGPATVTITVQALAVPVAVAQTATTLAGTAVTIHGATGASGGPFTAAAIVTAPTTGTAVVAGTDIIYTPPADASGAQHFTYTLSNVFGVSQPAPITVTVNPRPVALPLSASAVAGTTVHVELTNGATGGPFTAANVVSVTPANAGTGTVQKTANGYQLSFTAAPTFSGVGDIGFTLSNAFATSAIAHVSVTVTARSDPSKDAEVLGVLGAQVDATRRMATGQISNFQQRLESLHGAGAGAPGFSNALSFTSGGGRRQQGSTPNVQDQLNADPDRRYLVQPEDPVIGPKTKTTRTPLPGDISFWAGGAVNFGTQQLGGSANGVDFTTQGVSVGADKRVNDQLSLGAGFGYGHDSSDVGHNGSHNTTSAYNVAAYGSFHPSESTYIDGLLSYQWLTLDARRYVTDDGNRVNGSRDGKQWFGSIAFGYEHTHDDVKLSPYGRLDMANAKLDSYTEHGDDVYSLDYGRQTVKTTTGVLGFRADYWFRKDFGSIAPRFRVEYQHDFQGSSTATMNYADLIGGPVYRADVGSTSRNHTLLGLGIQIQTNSGMMLRAEYQNLLDSSSHDDQSILLGVEKQF